MTLNSLTIAAGIAALVINDPTTGKQITVLDIVKLDTPIRASNCPILFPHPLTWQGGANAEPSDGPATFGTPGGRYWIFNRKYQYVYLHSPFIAGRALHGLYSGMSANVDAILTALTALDLPGIDVKSVGCDTFGVIQDPARNEFHGCYINATLRERLNQ